jgi:curved DNA-binding protein CbpA
MNPYDVLGVGKAAAAPEIKMAYRRRSKAAHPDAGGTREAFDQLQLAYDVLRDPEARRRYDETGEVRPQAADNAHVAGLSALSAVFDQVIAETMKAGEDFTTVDLVARMRGKLEDAIAKRAETAMAMAQDRSRWQEMRDRFTSVEDRPTRLAAIVDKKLADIDRVKQAVDAADAAARTAIEILDDHRYRFDPEACTVAFHYGLGGVTRASTGFWTS